MVDLYSVMDELLEVEDELNAFKNISTTLYKSCCSGECESTDIKSLLCLTVKYIDGLSADLRHSIVSLDTLIAENATSRVPSE